VITTESVPGETTGGAYFVLLRGSGGVPPYSWTVADGSLPTGLTLVSSGLIRGGPTSAGTFDFTVRVEDSVGVRATESFQMVLVDPLVIDTAFLPVGTVGYSYSTTVAASGGTGPYSWSVADGSLPPGLVLGGSGELTGVPEGAAEAQFTVQVQDAAGRVVERSFTAETINPLVILTPLLPTGTTGSDYSFTMSGSGGRAPHTWSVSSGALPSGLTLSADGLIGGTPTVVTQAQLTISVTDADGRVAAFPYVLNTLIGQVRQTVVARGGTVVVDIVDDSVNLMSVVAADDFSAFTIAAGPGRVQVHFIGPPGVTPSWVLCEGDPAVSCSFD